MYVRVKSSGHPTPTTHHDHVTNPPQPPQTKHDQVLLLLPLLPRALGCALQAVRWIDFLNPYNHTYT